jgi:thiosulfate/3-mercaptopyruvate sulfurtransferase
MAGDMTQVFTTLIDNKTLAHHLDTENWIIVDCSYDLVDKNAGRNSYLESHIKGAVFADVYDDLSGPPVTDHGRHPLPSEEALNSLFSRLGIGHDSQVIVYDNACACFAGRLWWMLRYMGHKAVAVLDGGWQSWEEAGLAKAAGEEKNTHTNFQGHTNKDWLVTVNGVPAAELLVDSRDPQRYRGENEPLDKAAGHIPGAINRFWKNNLDASGLFKDSEQLRNEFEVSLGGIDICKTVFYCGSGVTACHNLLAMAHAGLDSPRLYAGSWSDWCSEPSRPVATGENP